MAGEVVTKAVVSVTEMARMVGLSRARFYQLVRRGTFPPADPDPASRRPCYGEEKQRLVLEARRRNCGVDGRPVLFYCRRKDAGVKRAAARPVTPKPRPTPDAGRHTALLDGLAALNVTATPAEVEPVLAELFPGGAEGVDPGEVIGAVFRRLRRQNPADRPGR